MIRIRKRWTWTKLHIVLICAQCSVITILAELKSSVGPGILALPKSDQWDKICPIAIFPRTAEELWVAAQPFMRNLLSVYQVVCPEAEVYLNDSKLEFAFKECINSASRDLVDEWCTVNKFEQKSAAAAFDKLREGSLLASRQLFQIHQTLVKPLCPFTIDAFSCLKSNYSTAIEQCIENDSGKLIDSLEDSVGLICDAFFPKLIRSGQVPCISAGIKCIVDNLIADDQVPETRSEWCSAMQNVHDCFEATNISGEKACRGAMNKSLEIISRIQSDFCVSNTTNTSSVTSSENNGVKNIVSFSNETTQEGSDIVIHAQSSSEPMRYSVYVVAMFISFIQYFCTIAN